MNLLDEKKLNAEVITPALDRLQHQIIPDLEGLVQRAIISAAAGLSDVIGIEGFVLEIEVPKITIRLRREPPLIGVPA